MQWYRNGVPIGHAFCGFSLNPRRARMTLTNANPEAHSGYWHLTARGYGVVIELWDGGRFYSLHPIFQDASRASRLVIRQGNEEMPFTPPPLGQPEYSDSDSEDSTTAVVTPPPVEEEETPPVPTPAQQRRENSRLVENAISELDEDAEAVEFILEEGGGDFHLFGRTMLEVIETGLPMTIQAAAVEEEEGGSVTTSLTIPNDLLQEILDMAGPFSNRGNFTITLRNDIEIPESGVLAGIHLDIVVNGIRMAPLGGEERLPVPVEVSHTLAADDFDVDLGYYAVVAVSEYGDVILGDIEVDEEYITFTFEIDQTGVFTLETRTHEEIAYLEEQAALAAQLEEE